MLFFHLILHESFSLQKYCPIWEVEFQSNGVGRTREENKKSLTHLNVYKHNSLSKDLELEVSSLKVKLWRTDGLPKQTEQKLFDSSTIHIYIKQHLPQKSS